MKKDNSISKRKRRENKKYEPNLQAIISTLSSCSDIGDNAPNHYQFLLNLKNEIRNSDKFKKITSVLKALGNDDRFLILELLREKDRCVCELEAALEKSQPTISRHLKLLEDAHLIEGWKHGKFTHYSIIQPTFDEYNKLWTNWVTSVENWFIDQNKPE